MDVYLMIIIVALTENKLRKPIKIQSCGFIATCYPVKIKPTDIKLFHCRGFRLVTKIF